MNQKIQEKENRSNETRNKLSDKIMYPIQVLDKKKYAWCFFNAFICNVALESIEKVV